MGGNTHWGGAKVSLNLKPLELQHYTLCAFFKGSEVTDKKIFLIPAGNNASNTFLHKKASFQKIGQKRWSDSSKWAPPEFVPSSFSCFLWRRFFPSENVSFLSKGRKLPLVHNVDRFSRNTWGKLYPNCLVLCASISWGIYIYAAVDFVTKRGANSWNKSRNFHARKQFQIWGVFFGVWTDFVKTCQVKKILWRDRRSSTNLKFWKKTFCSFPTRKFGHRWKVVIFPKEALRILYPTVLF